MFSNNYIHTWREAGCVSSWNSTNHTNCYDYMGWSIYEVIYDYMGLRLSCKICIVLKQKGKKEQIYWIKLI